MSGARRAALRAGAVGSAALTLASAGAVGLAVPELLAQPGDPEPIMVVTILLQPIWLVSLAGVALLLTLRQPSNQVGWLLAALGPLLGFIVGVWSYRWPVPDGWELEYAWLSTTASFYVVALAGPGLALIFPDGHLPSRRWRVPVAVAASTLAISALLVGFVPGYLAAVVPPESGVPVEASAEFGIAALAPFGELLNGIAFGSLIALLGLGVLGLIVRGRRGGSIVRAQLRWYLVATGLILVGLASSTIESALAPDTDTTVGVVFLFAGLVLTPVAVAIAVLRYRLYEIDVIIRRTLVYAAVVVVLGGVYVTLVLVLQTILQPVTGESALAVALSTLAIAALFGPVRTRVRAIVDRRFYRSRYDAQRTLEQLSLRLRDEVDIEAVGGALVALAGSVVRPTMVGLWIRGAGEASASGRGQ